MEAHKLTAKVLAKKPKIVRNCESSAKSAISNEAGRCQEFSSSFFDFLHLFLLDQAHPCACAGASLR
jgi:hypothetical protein